MDAQQDQRAAYVITGPTAGIGRAAALELARHGTVVLVGRDLERLERVRRRIERRGGRAIPIVCDVSDLASVQRAAAAIVALHLPIAALLNNAGIMEWTPSRTPEGWDRTFATNHLGPFALTEALAPHLPDGAQVLFVGSAVEDPGRKAAVAAGFRGGRFLSVGASARGEWKPGGAAAVRMDSYATSKQCCIAAALALSREWPRLRVNAVEPGFTPATSLGRSAPAVVRVLTWLLVPILVPLLKPFMPFLSTPAQSARMLTRLLTDPATPTGTYFDEAGRPLSGSAEVRDPAFQARVLRETRAFLASPS